jgi:hypothetical protein
MNCFLFLLIYKEMFSLISYLKCGYAKLYMIWYGSKNTYKKEHTFSKEIGLHSLICVLSIYSKKHALELQPLNHFVII